MLFDSTFVGPSPEDALVFISEILQSSTEYSVIGIDLDGTIRLWNEGARRQYSYEAEEVLGKAASGILCPLEGIAADRLRAVMEEAVRQGKWEGLLTPVRGNGQRFAARAVLTPWHAASGRHAGYLLISRDIANELPVGQDIAERRQTEDRFRRARRQLRDVVASSPAVLFTLSVEEGRINEISWISDNLREILGYSPETAIRSHWWLENIHPDDVESARSQTAAALFSLGRSTQRWRFRHADGSYRWIRSEIRLIRDEEGRPSGAVGAWLDVTDRQLAEEERSRLQAQLQQARKLESIGRLAGGVAHDFNNLLTVINGYSDLSLKKLNTLDPIHHKITQVRQAGQRAAALVSQLLLLSRKQVIQTSKVNLNDVIGEVERMLARVIGEDIQLRSVLSPSLGFVLADPGQLHQVLMNLAINARDAMPDGGTLLIETANIDLTDTCMDRHPDVTPGPFVQLKVSDTGVGMTKEVMSHLFEPFFTTKGPGEGTGLGLATVYGIVKQSAGSISVKSEPGEGTTFTICLPRTDVELSPRQDQTSGPSLLRGTETILVVEDQEQLREFTAVVLQDYGYRVLQAANAGEALLHSERCADPIHLMLTDVVMPGIGGPELADRLQALRPSMQVIFMSGYSEHEAAHRHELSGPFIQKPFSPEDLAGEVRHVLSR